MVWEGLWGLVLTSRFNSRGVRRRCDCRVDLGQSFRVIRLGSCRFGSSNLVHVDLVHVDLVHSIRFMSIRIIRFGFNQFGSRIMFEDEVAYGRRNMPWMPTVSRRLRFRFVVLRFRLRGFQDSQFIEVGSQFCRFGCKGSDDGIVLFILNDVSRVLKTAEA